MSNPTVFPGPVTNTYLPSRVDDYLPAVLRNHEFLSQNGWKNNIAVRHNPYTMVNNCEGKTIFEHLADDPKRLTRFNEAMMAADSGLVTVGLYPFQEELGSLATDDSVTMVDVGGGRGHVIRQIKGSVPNLKGKFILQDRPPVIEDNGKEIEAHRIEAMPHDFFNPQPVKGRFPTRRQVTQVLTYLPGALVYYIRRCFHDWPDEPESRQILENLAASMDRERSRILITEFIVPEVGSNMSLAWLDQTMMAFGGVERTEKDWARLLDISGLKLVKVWKAPGVPVGVVEARLK